MCLWFLARVPFDARYFRAKAILSLGDILPFDSQQTTCKVRQLYHLRFFIPGNLYGLAGLMCYPDFIYQTQSYATSTTAAAPGPPVTYLPTHLPACLLIHPLCWVPRKEKISQNQKKKGWGEGHSTAKLANPAQNCGGNLSAPARTRPSGFPLQLPRTPDYTGRGEEGGRYLNKLL